MRTDLSTLRDESIQQWLKEKLGDYKRMVLLAGDASFRRYFRVCTEERSFVLMDAPPNKMVCHDFIAIDRALAKKGVRVPIIHHAHESMGLMLLDDFGDSQLLSVLNEETVDSYYQRACEDLLRIQTCQSVPDYTLPQFDEALYRYEMNLFSEWYLTRHLGLALTQKDHDILERVHDLLIESALSQPQIFVHRDYHSRNLMVLPSGELGVLDFQDAVWGPITYDLMSLLKDCYIEWPYERVKKWVLQFQQRLLEENRLKIDNPDQFLVWFDWISLQRHLKCIGIFSRLNYRDHKAHYMADIPRVMRYAQSVCERHSVFTPLLERYFS